MTSKARKQSYKKEYTVKWPCIVPSKKDNHTVKCVICGSDTRQYNNFLTFYWPEANEQVVVSSCFENLIFLSKIRFLRIFSLFFGVKRLASLVVSLYASL